VILKDGGAEATASGTGLARVSAARARAVNVYFIVLVVLSVQRLAKDVILKDSRVEEVDVCQRYRKLESRVASLKWG
jgi:hypothetical protein